MYEYSVVDLTTGIIVRSGSASMYRDVIGQISVETELCIDGIYEPGKFRYENGTVVPFEPEPPAISVEDVKAFAQRLLRDTDWYVLRAQDPDGAPVPQEVWDYRAAVRAASNELEQMTPIPQDFRSPNHWPNRL